MTLAAGVIIVYLLLLTGLGIWHSRRIKTGDDFALAGRKLGLTVTVGTLVATWIGTGSLFGSPDAIRQMGLATFIYPLGGAAGILLLMVLAGKARALPAKSVPQILGLRFGRSAPTRASAPFAGFAPVSVTFAEYHGESWASACVSLCLVCFVSGSD